MDVTEKFIDQLSKMINPMGNPVFKEVKPLHDMNNTNLDPTYLYAFIEQIATGQYKYSELFQATLLITFASSHINADKALNMVSRDFYSSFNLNTWDTIEYCKVENAGPIFSIKTPVIGKTKQVEVVVRYQ